MMRCRFERASLVVIIGLVGLTGILAAAGQDGPPPTSQPALTDPTSDKPLPPRRRWHSRLQADSAETNDPLMDENLVDRALVEELSGGRSGPNDAVGETLNLMRQAAQSMRQGHDIGRSTQRLQEKIISGIDDMIESAENAASRQGGGKTRKSARRQSAQPQKQNQQPGKSGSSPGQKQGGAPSQTASKPPDPKTVLDRADLAQRWGFLPEQDRDEVIQGFDESFMPKFRDEILRYYRSLADDAAEN